MDTTAHILITAGPTHEPIDAVRYIANRSSGRLGIALAEEAAQRGHAVTLLIGPTHLKPQSLSQLTVLRFRTTADLQRLLQEHWPQHDVLIMAAAVADYRPQQSHPPNDPRLQKLSRSDQPLTLTLEPTPDLLATLATSKRSDQRTIGFALEPVERLKDSARKKLVKKNLDAIVANSIETMECDSITGAILMMKDGREIVAPSSLPKQDFARWLLDHL